MRGFRRMIGIQAILRSRRERRGNDTITDMAFAEWRRQFSEIKRPQRDAKGLLWQFRITNAVLRFYFHSGYSPKGASDEIVNLFTSRKWHMVEMMGRIQQELQR